MCPLWFKNTASCTWCPSWLKPRERSETTITFSETLLPQSLRVLCALCGKKNESKAKNWLPLSTPGSQGFSRNTIWKIQPRAPRVLRGSNPASRAKLQIPTLKTP